jgi:hypothetical protein
MRLREAHQRRNKNIVKCQLLPHCVQLFEVSDGEERDEDVGLSSMAVASCRFKFFRFSVRMNCVLGYRSQCCTTTFFPMPGLNPNCVSMAKSIVWPMKRLLREDFLALRSN